MTVTWRMSGSAAVGLALLPAMAMMAVGGHAATFETDNWRGYWDNTLTYNLGFRMRDVDDKIGNDPNYDESDYKFKDRGDVVTNRVNLLTELGGTYNDRLSMRLSAQGWHDFAYDDDVESNPDLAAAPNAYPSGEYSGGVKNEYISGGRLLDAFVQYSDLIGGRAYTARVGRNTQYWGNGLFFPMQSISYSQGAVDGIAGAASPGTPAKALFIPRNQVNLSTQVTSSVNIGMQYFLERAENILPQGGTYLGAADFLFTGPESMLGIPRGSTRRADEIADNFGVNLGWQATPGTTVGFYYRRLDEVQPWAPLIKLDGSAPSYFLSYNQGVDLFGISVDMPLGNSSLGLEVSYRDGTALNSTPNVMADDPERGATGNIVNVLANVLVPLGTTPFYETGTLTAELAHTRVLSVDGTNKSLYNGEGYQGCAGDKWDGCSTRSATALALSFTPEWIQTFPGVDMSMPTSITAGLKGNPGVLGGTAQGSYKFSIGLQAKYRSIHTLKVEYIGSRAHTGDTIVNDFGLTQYAGGNGPYMLNDRDWISITAQTLF
ncbi:DUF1302 family protein [Marinobacter sp. NFXS9]|uniref:DUF1302 domain-containing protein n=1 Tax=Marinobacter sp. NFXS9 TaxID=2818433 RepID=UPI0032DFD5EC